MRVKDQPVENTRRDSVPVVVGSSGVLTCTYVCLCIFTEITIHQVELSPVTPSLSACLHAQTHTLHTTHSTHIIRTYSMF